MIKLITNSHITNQTILLRLDLNVPTYKNKILSDFRIVKSIPTIRYLLNNNNKIIILSHFGRPKEGLKDPSLSLENISNYLAKKLNKKIIFYDDWIDGVDFLDADIVMCEIGLDYLPDMPDRAWQFDAFRKQISIARDFELPIIFHSRDAHNDCFRVLREERAFEVGGVMHYFQGSLYDAQTAIDSGFYISIARPLFRIDELQDVVKKISLEHIVIETDSAPQPFKKNRENWTEPRHLRSILLKIAELKDLSAQEVERIIFNNTKKLLSKRWESIEATFS